MECQECCLWVARMLWLTKKHVSFDLDSTALELRKTDPILPFCAREAATKRTVEPSADMSLELLHAWLPYSSLAINSPSRPCGSVVCPTCTPNGSPLCPRCVQLAHTSPCSTFLLADASIFFRPDGLLLACAMTQLLRLPLHIVVSRLAEMPTARSHP